MLTFYLYECKTWSLILREGHKLRAFENKVLRRIFEPKRERETERKKQQNAGNFIMSIIICILYRVIQSSRTRCEGPVERMGR
jgi:hypothetical protein